MKLILQAVRSLLARLELLISGNAAAIAKLGDRAEDTAAELQELQTTVEGNSGNIRALQGSVYHSKSFKLDAGGGNTEGEGCIAAGYGCAAIGDGTAAFGYNSVAKGLGQTAIGKCNVIDDNNDYAFIIGNGADMRVESRANIHTVDWDGNAWFAGNVECGKLIMTTESGKRYNLTMKDGGTIGIKEITE